MDQNIICKISWNAFKILSELKGKQTKTFTYFLLLNCWFKKYYSYLYARLDNALICSWTKYTNIQNKIFGEKGVMFWSLGSKEAFVCNVFLVNLPHFLCLCFLISKGFNIAVVAYISISFKIFN